MIDFFIAIKLKSIHDEYIKFNNYAKNREDK